MTTRRDIDDAISFEQQQPLPAWWDTASEADRAKFAQAQAARSAKLRAMKPDGLVVYPAGGALEDGPS